MYIPELSLEITPDTIDMYLSLFAVILDRLINYKKELQEAETDEYSETDSDENLIDPVLKNPHDYQ